MRGHIRKRAKGTWTLVLELPRGEDGKRKQQWIAHRGTKREAERELARRIHEIETGQFAHPSTVTVAAFLKHWMELAIRGKKAATTVYLFDCILNTHLIPRLGHHKLEKLTTYQLQRYFHDLGLEGRRGGGGLAQKTLLSHYAVLRAALLKAVQWRYLNFSPLVGVDPPEPVTKERDPLTLDQVRILLEKGAETRYFGPILFAVCYGMRIGEITGIRWKDVDRERNLIHVRQNLVWPAGKPVFTTPKGKRFRSYPLLDPISLFLCKRAADASELRGDDLIFPHPNSGPWPSGKVRLGYYQVLADAGLPKVRFHDLRHTNSALLLSAGIPMLVVSRWLGHHSEAITDGIYGHLLPGVKSEAGAVLGRLLQQALPPVSMASPPGTKSSRKTVRVCRGLAKRARPGT